MIKKYVIFILLFFLICSMTASEKFVSPYVGIFDVFDEYKNGELPHTRENYTGYWKLPGLEGYYENGIPQGVWRSYYENGILFAQFAYCGSSFLFYTYFPDGSPCVCGEGETTMTDGIFSHKQRPTAIWNFNTEKLSEDSQTKQVSGWRFDRKKNPTIHLSCSTKIDNLKIEIFKMILNENTCSFAIYFSTDKTFLGKKVIDIKLDPISGQTSVVREEEGGQVNPIDWSYLLQEKPADDGTKEVGVVFRLGSQPYNEIFMGYQVGDPVQP